MKKFLSLVLVLLMVASLSSVASATSYKVGLAMADLNTEFWQGNYRAIYETAAELDVEIIEAIADDDANVQNEQISQLIAKGCQAIICAAVDSVAIDAAIEDCLEAGVYIIMDNRPTTGSAQPSAQILSDNYQMAYDEMNWLIGYCKANDVKFENAIMLIGDLGDENAIQRRDGFKKAIEEDPGYVNVVIDVPTEWNHEVALAGLQNALQAYPDVDIIITPSDFLFTPIQSALEQVGKWAVRGEENHVAIISFDGDVNGMQMLKDGYNWANAAQGAIEQGQMCVKAAVALINGETLDATDTIDPGIIATFENLDEVAESVWGWAGVK